MNFTEFIQSFRCSSTFDSSTLNTHTVHTHTVITGSNRSTTPQRTNPQRKIETEIIIIEFYLHVILSALRYNDKHSTDRSRHKYGILYLVHRHVRRGFQLNVSF